MSEPGRIEVDSLEQSSQAKALERKLAAMGHAAGVRVSKAYTLNHAFSPQELERIAAALHNPVVETARINEVFEGTFDWALELGFLPGVTDNVANTTTELIEDLLKTSLPRDAVFSSTVLYIKGALTEEDVRGIALALSNTLIERHHLKTAAAYRKDGGMDRHLPLVRLDTKPGVLDIDLDIPDNELQELGKKGIANPDGTRRGPLALDLDYLHAIKAYFVKEGRKPTDIELESIAQTWSEHCKHTIFADPLDDIEEGIFTRFIKGATEKVREALGKDDFCLSVFTDNSGGIVFDEDWMVTDKAETHNSPSALDPFGGAITGIVGVNRDTIGFGMGALPIANKYGFCVGPPEDDTPLFRGKGKTNPALPPRRVLDGVVDGVNVGGNCSGIPTPTGFVYTDEHYRGKPLIFVGTVGLLPRKQPNGKPAHEKAAQHGDAIVMIGGRVGKDGIHGATFSSEALDEGSPATAVQIGDPITQKKFSDAVVKEARDLGLYHSITDNGAGGLSCSVAEMAEECGGFTVRLEKVPLKYPGLEPWQIWISESQERMTLAVPQQKLDAFLALMKSRGVEASVIGEFNNGSRGVVTLDGDTIFDLDMNFLHNGLPKQARKSAPYPYKTEEPAVAFPQPEKLLFDLLGSHNICSHEWISRQYDHEVQGTSVIKPLQGKGRVNGPASVIKPLFRSRKGIVMSQALLPRLSEIDCYAMAACAIDTAIRSAVAAGADPGHLALMDNFCWCSSDEPERLAQLKDAARGCYDYATAYRTPFISGKDSMFNDFKGYDQEGKRVKISVLPTLMISALGVIDDCAATCTLDLKHADDLIYVLGETANECGASELYHLLGAEGGRAPEVDSEKARERYEKLHAAIAKGLVSACAPVNAGGLGVWLAKMSIAGQLGLDVDLQKVPHTVPLDNARILHSESQSRCIATIDPKNKREFEAIMEGSVFAEIGTVRTSKEFAIRDGDDEVVRTTIRALERRYKERFAEY